MKKINNTKILMAIALLEVLLLIVLLFCLESKIKEQKVTIDKQSAKIKECDYEIKRLKLVEQDYETDKEYIYQCFKEIELKAERSGK